MWRWAETQTASGGQPVYGYMFAREHPYAPGISFTDHDTRTAGVYHASDIVYWTGNLDAYNAYRHTRNWTEADRQLSNQLMDVAIAFAHTGKPQTAAVPAVRFDPANARVVELNTSGWLIGPAVRISRF